MTNERSCFSFVGVYEAREFPKGWHHPKDEHDTFIPLLPYGYAGLRDLHGGHADLSRLPQHADR